MRARALGVMVIAAAVLLALAVVFMCITLGIKYGMEAGFCSAACLCAVLFLLVVGLLLKLR